MLFKAEHLNAPYHMKISIMVANERQHEGKITDAKRRLTMKKERNYACVGI